MAQDINKVTQEIDPRDIADKISELPDKILYLDNDVVCLKSFDEFYNIDLTNIEYSLAKCCQPIFGDPVFAFLSATGGVKIHRIGCPNELEMRRKFNYRILEARWTGTEGNLMPVTLRITGSDDIGIVTNISQIVTKDTNVKMRSITVNTTEGGFEGDVTVLVLSTDMLNGIMKKIKSIKGVYTVVRIK